MSPSFGYGEHEWARRVTEPPKRSSVDGRVYPERRSPFARDRARVLHSAALRRLAGKTQVVGPGEGAEVTGMPRTRLTHSLEVAQIGRSIAEELGADPDVVDTAGLAHDIGHPPFGHNGEQALDEVAARCGGFEGNAQTLRTLVRLEPKVDGAGLNLTRASLDAACKYPWPAADGLPKYGVYAEDLAAFEWLREGAPARRRCLEAQIMDWADDVAYSVHDVEDGILAGRIDLAALGDREERAALAALAGERFGADAPACELAGARLAALPVLAPLTRAGSIRPSGRHVALKALTSELVSRFAMAAVRATWAVHGERPLGRYEGELVVPPTVAAEVALRYVMSDPRRLRAQATQRELLVKLAHAIARWAPGSLAEPLREAWQVASSDDERWRVVIDQVAALTDQQAYAWHARLVGR